MSRILLFFFWWMSRILLNSTSAHVSQKKAQSPISFRIWSPPLEGPSSFPACPGPLAQPKSGTTSAPFDPVTRILMQAPQPRPPACRRRVEEEDRGRDKTLLPSSPPRPLAVAGPARVCSPRPAAARALCLQRLRGGEGKLPPPHQPWRPPRSSVS